MAEKLVSTNGILDEAADTVSRTAAPWLGVLWISALPVRLMQVYFLSEVRALGGASREYGNYLWVLSLTTTAALLVSLYGRAVYVRACRLTLQFGRAPGGKPLRVPFTEFAAYVYSALMMEVLFFLLLWTFVAAPMFILFAGLAAVTAHRVDRPGLIRPLREVLRAAAGLPPGLMLVFISAIVIAWVNLLLAVHGALWLAGGIAGWDLAAWQQITRKPLALLLVLAGASLAVEPFWLASLTVYVYRSKVTETGEDLRQWFHQLREDAT